MTSPPFTVIPGDGNVPFAVTDLRDVGRYTARIIVDPRTLNKFVFAYTEAQTFNQAIDILDDVAGEKATRNYVSLAIARCRYPTPKQSKLTGANLQQRPAEQIRSTISDAQKRLDASPGDQNAYVRLVFNQYLHSIGVRGDNAPSSASYLGYLDIKDLYPELRGKTLREIYQDIVDGKSIGGVDSFPDELIDAIMN